MDKCTIIAEIGSTHDGSFGNALRMIAVAAECGVDAVKFQTHISEAETLPDAPMPSYFTGEPRFSYFRRTGFEREQWEQIAAACREHGVQFLSSPFSVEAANLLHEVGIDAFKIPSGEVTNLPMLDHIARLGRPIILSSGMSDWNELDEAVAILRNHTGDLTVLQCTSAYPAGPEEIGLNVMEEMRTRYDLPVGLSDHSLSNYASFAAVTRGASVIEKHFTLSKQMYGSDAQHSLEPSEFADLVRGIRSIETMLSSHVDKNDVRRFHEMKEIFQKSIVSVRSIAAGETITADMVAIKKPGTGIPAKHIDTVIGSTALRSIAADRVLQPDDVSVNL